MAVNKDFEELLHLLNTARSRYLVVGAYAVIYHTEPRYTKDIDIWIDPDPKNAEKVYQVLKSFGAPLRGVTPDDLTNPTMVYQIGVEPNRIDILMGIGLPSFGEAWRKRRVGRYGKERTYILGLDDLIEAKKKAGRPNDLRDLAVLKIIPGKKKRPKRG